MIPLPIQSLTVVRFFSFFYVFDQFVFVVFFCKKVLLDAGFGPTYINASNLVKLRRTFAPVKKLRYE